MEKKYDHEKILIIVALVLCAGILFYNAFFIPDISIPSVIYVNENADKEAVSEDLSSEIPSDEDLSSSLSNNDSSKQTSSVNSSNQAKDAAKSQTKVNINTATAEELDEKLSGIGPVIAKKIIEYRNSVGRFYSIEEIKNVSGIGDKTFEKFKDMICVWKLDYS